MKTLPVRQPPTRSRETLRLRAAALVITFLIFLLPAASGRAATPLPSWNDTPRRQAIISFVAAVTDPRSPDYVAPEKRVAVFDNDGTMWSEKPLYFQMFFVFSRIRELAPRHPEWRQQQPFKAVLENDRKALRQCGLEGLKQLLAASRAGASDAEFAASVRRWAARARHPRWHRPFTQLAFQPMLELLSYLKNNGFTCFIVSGGGVDFMRVLLPEIYRLPPWRIIGSYPEAVYRDGKVIRLPKIAFFDNGPQKPVAIAQKIGIRPLLACGNSDGDLEMLQYTAAGQGKRLAIYIHHTDAVREYAYDRKSRIGHLCRGLDCAAKNNWLVVDMKQDWRVVYPAEKPADK